MAVSWDALNDANTVGLDDPFTADKWYIESFPMISGVTLSTLAVDEVNVVFAGFQQKARDVATTQVKWAKSTTISGFSMRFHLDQKAAVIKYILAWQRLVQNPYTGGFGLPSAYKKNLRIYMYDNSGKNILRHTVRNVWPQGIQEIGLNGTGGRVVLSVTFELDASVPEVLV